MNISDLISMNKKPFKLNFFTLREKFSYKAMRYVIVLHLYCHTFSFLKVASTTIVLQEEGKRGREGESEGVSERRKQMFPISTLIIRTSTIMI